MENEVWVDASQVTGRNLYEVSNMGNVRSKDRVSKLDGHLIRGIVLKKHRAKSGYMVVGMYGKTVKVSRIVCTAFNPNPENKPEVNHINGIKADDRAVNLEWNTRLENQRHAICNGLVKLKLNSDEIYFIRENYGKLGSVKLSKMFGISRSYVVDVALGRNIKHLGGIKQNKSNWTGDTPKPIIEYDINWNEVARYTSASQASKIKNIPCAKIRSVLTGLRPTYKGKRYVYVDETIANKFKKNHNNRKLYQYDLSGNKVGEYRSVPDAEAKTGISKYLIRDVISGKQKKTHNYVFKYA